MFSLPDASGSSQGIFLHPKKCMQAPMVGLFPTTPAFILKASSPSRNTFFLLFIKLLQPAQRSNLYAQRSPAISQTLQFSGCNIYQFHYNSLQFAFTK